MIGDVVNWIITIGFSAIGAMFWYVFNRINLTRDELNKHQQDTEKRLGEFIRREELNSILDKLEHRIEKQLSELKEIIKEWMHRIDDNG